MADKSSSVHENEHQMSVSNDIQNELLSTVAENIQENVNVPNTHDKSEIVPRNGFESDKSVLNGKQKKMFSHCNQSSKGYDKNEISETITSLEESNKICTITSDLKDAVINLLRLKMKLVMIKSEIFRNNIINAVSDVQLKVNESLATYFTESGICKNKQLEEIQNLIESSTNEENIKKITIDVEQIVKETQDAFSNYQKVFGNCKSVLEDCFLKNIERKLNVNVSRNLVDTQSAYFALLKDVSSHKIFLNSSMKASEEFEAQINDFDNISTLDLESGIDILLSAIDKAEVSCTDLMSFASVLLNFGYAKV